MFNHGVMSSMSWHPISCPTISYSYHISYQTFYIVSHGTRYYHLLNENQSTRSWWDTMRFCCSGLATELLDVGATAHLPALCAWPQKSWQRWQGWESHEDSTESLLLWLQKKTQVCSSTVYKMQDTLYASISFCSKAGIHAWYQGWWP